MTTQTQNVTTQMLPVTMRALIARINRKLAHEGEVLKATRGDGKTRQDLGDYYVVDVNRNLLVEGYADPVELGRRLKVLRPRERVEEERG